MKTSKRILGIVLALAIVFNVFAVSTFAAGTESAIDLFIRTDESTYAPGDVITLTISEQVIDKVGEMRIGGQYPIAYDSSAIEPISTVTTELNSHNFVAIQGGYDPNMSGLFDTSAEVIDDKYNWDSIFFLSVADDMSTSFDATNKVDLFTVQLKVKDNAPDGEYTLGFNQGSYEAYSALSNDAKNGGVYGYYDDNGYGTTTNYGLGTCTFTVSSAPAVTVEAKDPMAHMNNWEDTEATTYTAGLVGQINGLALTFDETTGECDQIKEIKVTVEGSDKVGYAYKVYKVNDTTYQFRAILLDTPKTGTAALKYTFHVKLADGSTVTCSDETTAKEIFDAAYGRYQDSKKNA